MRSYPTPLVTFPQPLSAARVLIAAAMVAANTYAARTWDLPSGAQSLRSFGLWFGAALVLSGWRRPRPPVPRPWAVRAIAVAGCLALPFLAFRDESLSDAPVAGVVFVAIAGAVTSLYVQRATTV
jgi:hypothetical protein